MKTILLNVRDEKVENVDAEGLRDYYRLIGCSTIDIVSRKIGGRWFDIVCDDEGLFNEPVKISAINNMGSAMLAGNLLFFNHDGEGNLLPLSDDDCYHIQKYIQKMSTRKYPEGYPMLTQCEYC